MFRARIMASERTSVDREVARLKERASTRGLPPSKVEALTAEVGEVLSAFVERGRTIVAANSRMTVDRTVEGPGYQVRIHFETGGGTGGLLSRVRRALGM